MTLDPIVIAAAKRTPLGGLTLGTACIGGGEATAIGIELA